MVLAYIFQKKLIYLGLFLFISFLCVGCAKKVNERMQSWVGHHYSELIGSWGRPTYIYDDGKGGRIFMYNYSSSYTIPGQTNTNSTGQIRIYDGYGQIQSQ